MNASPAFADTPGWSPKERVKIFSTSNNSIYSDMMFLESAVNSWLASLTYINILRVLQTESEITSRLLFFTRHDRAVAVETGTWNILGGNAGCV